MMYGIYLSGAGAAVQDYRVDVLANNLANVDTTGFKRDLSIFLAREAEAVGNPDKAHLRHALQDRVGGGVLLASTVTRHEPGSLMQTGRALDLAITGDGYFWVRGQDGRIQYTRAGNFRVNAEGELVTADGAYRVLDTGGAPLTVESADDLAIGETGLVSRQGDVLGEIGLRSFPDPSILRKSGDNQFIAAGDDLGTPAPEARVSQGYLEGSAAGARMMQEMVDLLSANRMYDFNMQALRIQDEMLGQTVTRVGAVA